MTTHARIEQLLAAAIDFDLTPAEHADLADHITTCPACRALAAAYRSDAYSLRGIAFAEPPARVRSAVFAATARPAVRTFEPWKLLAAALLVGLTIGAALVGSVLLRRSTPLGNGPLIIYQVRGDFADIFTLDIASGVQAPLGSIQLNAPIGGQRIGWTADGRSAFVFGDSDHLQARVDLVARRIVPLGLSNEGETDAVSPDGNRVARLAGDTERGMRLSVVDLRGTEILDVPVPAGAELYSSIVWAPDGTSLLLSGCLPCDQEKIPSPTNHEHLFLVPLDGSPIRQLTDDSAGLASYTRFSPDGSTIAYSTVTCFDACSGGIATVGVADGRVTQLTTSGPDIAPAWSPEGDRIAFQRGGAGGGIFVMDRDGSDLARLTTVSSGQADRDRAPIWSPDAEWIAFNRGLSDTSLGDLWVVPSDGGDERQLVQNAVADWGPTTTMLAVLPPASASALPPAPPSTRPLVSASTSAAPLGSPTSSGPILLGGSLLLVFQVDGTTNANATTQSVFLVDIASGGRTKLRTLPFSEATCCPDRVQWSADRQRVVLSSELGVQAIVDLRAGTVGAASAAPPGQFKAAISTRGDRVARVDEVTGIAPTIVISDLAGQELTRLWVPVIRSIFEMSWSPGDMTLAVIGCGPCEGGSEPTTVTHLLLVPVDGSPARDVADNAAEVAAAPALKAREHWYRSYGGAAWSPDGGTIALADVACVSGSGRRTVNGVEVRERYACTGRLLSVDVASGEQTVVMQDQGVPGTPSWSPDGMRLAFGQFASSGERQDLPNCYPCDRLGLFVIDRDGNHLTRLADGDGPAAWSPDGTWLVYPRYDWELPEDSFRGEMWVVPASGGEAKRIAEHAAAGW